MSIRLVKKNKKLESEEEEEEMTIEEINEEQDKEKKRGPHWVVQLCCRQFNSAGPHHVFHVFVLRREQNRIEQKRLGKSLS